jgi:translation initiation factor IF-1
VHMDSESSNGVVSRSLGEGYFDVRLPDGTVRVCFVSPELRKAGTTVGEGDRVSVGAEVGGVFRGEITRAWQPQARTLREPVPARASLIARSDPSALQPRDQRIDRQARPGWPTGAECAPRIGDVVYCTAGLGTVLRVLGRTGNGSRLLELRLPAAGNVSFFASGSNVLMAPREGVRVAAGTVATP